MVRVASEVPIGPVFAANGAASLLDRQVTNNSSLQNSLMSPSCLPTIALGRNILNVDGLKSEKTIKLVGLKNKKLENEIKTLTNVEGVRIVDRPLLLSVLTMPKKYQFDDTAFFGETPASNASVECFDHKTPCQKNPHRPL